MIIRDITPWQQEKLGDCFRIKHGYAFKGQFFSDHGPYVLLTPGNFYDEGGFKHKGDREKFYTGDVPLGFVLDKGDLIVAMTEQAEGLLGSCAIIPECDQYLHNQRLGLITGLDERKLNERFLYYLFNSRDVRMQIRATANGAKVRHTSPSRIYEVKVQLPPVGTQHKIAAILSAYDDLIENNLRRIKILEEMAQALYREWFVNFRFPGHEHVGIGSNRQWEHTPLKDVTTKIGSGATPRGGKGSYKLKGVTLIRSMNVYDYRFENDGVTFIDDKQAAGLANVEVEPYDILLNITGASVARCCMVPSRLLPARVNQHVAIIRVDQKQAVPYYVLSCINDPENKGLLLALAQGGATREALTKNTIERFEIPLPPYELLQQFHRQTEPITELVEILRTKNICLRQTHDLLLPKLLSGDVDVSALEISIGQDTE